MVKYYDPNNTRLKCKENSFVACPYCGAEVYFVGPALNFCYECDVMVEGSTVTRYYNVEDEFGEMLEDGFEL